jgi:hypothetical protein
MEIKYTPAFLSKIEDIFAESNHFLRYEKGNFKSGYCILKEKRVIIVNKYFSLEGKINCLLEILKQVVVETEKLSEKTLQLYEGLIAKETVS